VDVIETEITDTTRSFTHFYSQLIKTRDLATYRHSENVLAIVKRILTYLGINGRMGEIAKIGCMLHDLGKVSIRDAVLRKTGLYTSEEYEEIKNHTIAGYHMVKEVEQHFPYEVIEIIKSHHEKNGGTGYPDCITEVPFHVQVVALADIAAAMQEHRYHRTGLPLSNCLEEISQHRWDERLFGLVKTNPEVLGLSEKERNVTI
jgi:putative two-component system response regulator